MESVELIQAFEWICDECGRSNFESAIAAELTPAEEKTLRIQFNMDEHDGGDFLRAPDTVICSHCDCEFEADVGESLSNDEFNDFLDRK